MVTEREERERERERKREDETTKDERFKTQLSWKREEAVTKKRDRAQRPLVIIYLPTTKREDAREPLRLQRDKDIARNS